MTLQIQVLAWDRLKNVAGFYTSDGRVFAFQQDNTWLHTTQVWAAEHWSHSFRSRQNQRIPMPSSISAPKWVVVFDKNHMKQLFWQISDNPEVEQYLTDIDDLSSTICYVYIFFYCYIVFLLSFKLHFLKRDMIIL